MQQLLLRQVLLFSDTFVPSKVVLKIVNVIAVEGHSYHLILLSVTSYPVSISEGWLGLSANLESHGKATIAKQKNHGAVDGSKARVKINGS